MAPPQHTPTLISAMEGRGLYGLGVVRFGGTRRDGDNGLRSLRGEDASLEEALEVGLLFRRDRGVVADAGQALDFRLDLWPARPETGISSGVVHKARHRSLDGRAQGDCTMGARLHP